MIHNYKANYKSIVLNPLLECDIEDMRVLRNKYRHCFIYSEIISQDEQKKWYDKYINTPNDYMFSINKVGYNDFIGAVGLYDIKNNIGEFGRLMLDKEKITENGLGVDIVLCACKIAFEQLQLDKIKLEVFQDNIAAYKTYQKAGFNNYFSEHKDDRVIFHMEKNKVNI